MSLSATLTLITSRRNCGRPGSAGSSPTLRSRSPNGWARAPTIYFDVRRLTSGVELAQLLEHARKAAIFLAIVSPSYVARDWTRDELKSFLSTHGSSARLCPVEVLPLDNETEYPSEFVKVKRVNFWFSPGEAGTPVTIQADLHAEKYYDRLQDLAFDLRRRLKEIAADRPVATREMPAAAPKTDKSTTALLAQVTDDLEDDRNDVRRHLEQFGVRVLPSNAYPQGGADFRAAFAADCAQANLFVQLLGPVGSRHPPDLAASYATTQYDLAKQQGLERKLWRRPDLKLELIKHRDVLLLYAPETEAIGLEAFKSDLVRHLTTPPTPPRNRPAGGGGIIFINADPSDLPLAESIYQEMRKGLYSAALPYFKGTSEEIRLDLEGSWSIAPRLCSSTDR